MHVRCAGAAPASIRDRRLRPFIEHIDDARLVLGKLKVSRGTPFGPKTITLPPYFFTSLAVATVRSSEALRCAGSVRFGPP